MLLSLDVGFAAMGWVLFDQGEIYDCGVIRTEKTQKKNTRVADDHAHRSAVLAEQLRRIIQTNKVKGIIGELPSGGALSAKAMAFMASATSIVAAVGALMVCPMEWTTPGEVKKVLAGHRSASKEIMMAKAAEMFGFKEEGKKFFMDGESFNKGDFEHIADAIGVYVALKNDNLVKMFG